MDKCSKIAALYVATLKAIALIHTHSHWTAKGGGFYADHLLFERIYNDTLKNLDLAAEKFIGVLGEDCMDYDLQSDLLHKVLLKYEHLEGTPLQMSLAVERDFLAFSKAAYRCFEEEGKLTLGLDDAICEIASKREEAVYLLQQTLKKGNISTYHIGVSMDTKKVIEKLVKIAEKQQQIINKLAQIQTPPTGLHPAAPTHNVLGKLQEVAPDLMKLVDVVNSRQSGNHLQLKFKPGATGATVQALQHKVDELVNKVEVAGGPFTVVPA